MMNSLYNWRFGENMYTYNVVTTDIKSIPYILDQVMQQIVLLNLFMLLFRFKRVEIALDMKLMSVVQMIKAFNR